MEREKGKWSGLTGCAAERSEMRSRGAGSDNPGFGSVEINWARTFGPTNACKGVLSDGQVVTESLWKRKINAWQELYQLICNPTREGLYYFNRGMSTLQYYCRDNINTS